MRSYGSSLLDLPSLTEGEKEEARREVGGEGALGRAPPQSLRVALVVHPEPVEGL